MGLSIHILHNLPGRVRIKFSRPIKDVEKLKEHVMEHEGIETMAYSPHTATMLVIYDNTVVELQEIMIRVAVAYSAENNLGQIRISQQLKHQFITPKAILAGMGIIASTLTSILIPAAAVKKPMEWLAAITTAVAVLEHAAYDYQKKGSVDPEVLSLVFLANWAISGKNMLLPSALTWVATFGRHFSASEGEGIMLDITRTTHQGKHREVEINISKLKTNNNLLDILHVFTEKFLSTDTSFDNTIFEKSKNLLNTHDKMLEGVGVGSKKEGIVLHFNQ